MNLDAISAGWLGFAILMGVPYCLRMWLDGADDKGNPGLPWSFHLISFGTSTVLLMLAFGLNWWLLVLAGAVGVILVTEYPLRRVAGWFLERTGRHPSVLTVLPMIMTALIPFFFFTHVDFRPSLLLAELWSQMSGLSIFSAVDEFAFVRYVAAFVFLSHPMNYLVRTMMQGSPEVRLHEGHEKSSNAVFSGRSEAAATSDMGDRYASSDRYPDTAAAGRVIGILERWIVVTLVVAGQYALVGLVLSAKSLARIPDLHKNRVSAEYYLVGTLYSLLGAMVVGMILRAGV